MRFLSFVGTVISLAGTVSSTILQNGQVRITNYPNTTINPASYEWKTYSPDATELSYKGRWDSKHISWWSTPGLKFGFSGQHVAITFGPHTVDRTLIAYRINGLDWQLTNVTTNATHLLVSPSTPGVNVTTPINPTTFELRVTNWAYGVQIDSVHIAKGEKLIKIPNHGRTIEIIGDSLASGMYGTLEGLSGFGYGIGAGLGETEYSITAYPGICVYDKECWGNPRGHLFQWFHTSDTSWRNTEIYGDKPEVWDFSKHAAADIVVICIGTNDANAHNNVPPEGYVAQYTMFIEGIHTVWPNAQIVLVSLWGGFSAVGNTYQQQGRFGPEIYSIYKYFNSREYLQNNILYDPKRNVTYESHRSSKPFVHYFNSTGTLQHNDYGPQYHPTDVGHIKIASHLIQYIKLKFDWLLYATGPEVQHETLYWNDEPNY
ncbi:GDSL-like Lipase/Acylhydrolase-like protein [Bisporella sp. PMI_857]|nr:GDSL-like Lipase/Acylhydrolase-like protein [Bisporella sp. PMI_857]